MKALHFGAGKIGRGFIADLLHDSGYDIVFADVYQPLIDELNEYKNYYLYVIEEDYRRKVIDHVSALSTITQEDAVVEEIAAADIITTAVIADNFPKIAVTMAKGLKKRIEAGNEKVNVIPCENYPYCGDLLARTIVETGILSKEEVSSIASIPNTVVDRLVFDHVADGRNGVEIGKDFELVIEQNRLKDVESQPIHNAVYTKEIDKFLQRKLYVINGGHSAAGYVAFLQGYTYIQDYFNTKEGYEESRNRMIEISGLIEKMYGFTHDEMVAYVDFSLNRWMTPGVHDDITRISRAPIRKLAPTDRFIKPVLGLEEYGLPNGLLIKSIAAAFLYDVKEDAQSVELLTYVKENGIEKAIATYTGLSPKSKIAREIIQNYEELKQRKRG